MNKTRKVRNVCFVLLGAAALVLKGQYSGPFAETVYSYGGNVTASFAVYFLVGILPIRLRFRRLLTAGIALLVVELFEALDGFGVMSNVHDLTDFAANAVGIGLALAIDTAASGISTRRFNRREPAASGKGGQPAA